MLSRYDRGLEQPVVPWIIIGDMWLEVDRFDAMGTEYIRLIKP